MAKLQMGVRSARQRFGVRWQAQRDTAFAPHADDDSDRQRAAYAKAASPLRSAAALHMARLIRMRAVGAWSLELGAWSFTGFRPGDFRAD
jgi:hypothetical protein